MTTTYGLKLNGKTVETFEAESWEAAVAQAHELTRTHRNPTTPPQDHDWELGAVGPDGTVNVREQWGSNRSGGRVGPAQG